MRFGADEVRYLDRVPSMGTLASSDDSAWSEEEDNFGTRIDQIGRMAHTELGVEHVAEGQQFRKLRERSGSRER